jgi:hypothetical protein
MHKMLCDCLCVDGSARDRVGGGGDGKGYQCSCWLFVGIPTACYIYLVLFLVLALALQGVDNCAAAAKGHLGPPVDAAAVSVLLVYNTVV